MRRLAGIAIVAGAAIGGGGCKGKAATSGKAPVRDGSPVQLVEAPKEPVAEARSATAAALPDLAAIDEVEPNDEVAHGQPLKLAEAVHGRTTTSDDVDVYALASGGTVRVWLAPAKTCDVTLEVDDLNGRKLAMSSRGKAGVLEGAADLELPAAGGRVVVRARPQVTRPGSKGPQAVVCDYTLSVWPITPGAAQVEREPDDDRGAAGELGLDDEVTGFVGWNGDVDVWKLSTEDLADRNVFDLEASGVPGTVLTLEVQNGVGATLATGKSVRGAPASIKALLPTLQVEGSAAAGPPFLYVVVKGSPSSPVDRYTLHAHLRMLGDHEEAEPNDKAVTATAVPRLPDATEVTRIEGHWYQGDVDVYAVAKQSVQLTMDVSLAPSAPAGLKVEILVGDAVIATAQGGYKGEAIVAHAGIPAGAAALVRISTTGSPAQAPIDYELAIDSHALDAMPPEEGTDGPGSDGSDGSGATVAPPP